MFKKIRLLTTAVLLVSCQLAIADRVVPMAMVAEAGGGKAIGTITISEQPCGVLLIPDLQGLPPGIHGFHIHDLPSCDKMGMAAGGHFDPARTGKHDGPYSEHGHQGDLPVLIVDANGKASLPIFAPKLTMASFLGHALMIHANGDNYADQPEKLGGGGARIACGVVNPS